MTEGVIHQTAARGFEMAAEVYERARPGYPADAVDYVVEQLGVAGGTVLDLAAGTGKLTRELVARGVRCVAVEPVAGMRSLLREALPEVSSFSGTAEDIPLDPESVDGVTVAQAFHWFDVARALPEIHRVLKPEGKMALIWNVRDESHDWVARITEIIKPYEGADGVKIPRHRKGAWRALLESSALFARVAAREFLHTQPMTIDGLIERVASTSFIAILPETDREAVLDEVRALADTQELRGRTTFEFPYITEVYVYARR